MLTVTVPASNTNLTTLADVKTALALSDTAQDALLTMLIRQASRAIERYTKRFWAQQTYTETLPGYDNNYLMVSRTPIQSVSQVLYNGAVVDPSTYTVEDADAGLIFGQVPWFWTTELWVGLDLNPQANSELRRYAVDYVGGYNLPGDATQTTPLPDEIEQAAIDTVRAWLRASQRDPWISEKQIGDYRVRYGGRGGDVMTAIPMVARGLLDTWVRVT